MPIGIEVYYVQAHSNDIFPGRAGGSQAGANILEGALYLFIEIVGVHDYAVLVIARAACNVYGSGAGFGYDNLAITPQLLAIRQASR
jgi:hypothetical protein